LYCIVLYCIALYHLALYCIALYHLVLCIVLYCIALHCIALHCIMLYCSFRPDCEATCVTSCPAVRALARLATTPPSLRCQCPGTPWPYVTRSTRHVIFIFHFVFSIGTVFCFVVSFRISPHSLEPLLRHVHCGRPERQDNHVLDVRVRHRLRIAMGKRPRNRLDRKKYRKVDNRKVFVIRLCGL
jgi:hypothetical protein